MYYNIIIQRSLCRMLIQIIRQLEKLYINFAVTIELTVVLNSQNQLNGFYFLLYQAIL